jgi:hypothetical protein
MVGIYNVLEKIKGRPGMYIGKPSITILRHFLVGYVFARSELGIELSEEDTDFCENFQLWVQNRYNVRTSNSWANIILLFTRDEKDALNCFFKLLDEFKQRDKSLDRQDEKVIKTFLVQNGKLIDEITENKEVSKLSNQS